MKSKKVAYPIIITLFIAFISISILAVNYFRVGIKIDAQNLQKNNNYLYYSLQHQSSPSQSDVQSFKDLYQTLSNSNLYTYYEIYEQPLNIPYTSSTFFIPYDVPYPNETTGPFQSTSSIQISQNVQDDFNFSVLEGRLLQADDFIYNGKNSIPVLMGQKYAQQFDIGDSFSANYLFDDYNFHIVGFLQTGNKISTSLNDILLDSYIIMPSFEITDDVPQTMGLKVHYANKTSGKIKVTPENFQAASTFFIPLLENSPAGSFTWHNTSISLNFKQNFGISLHTAFYILIAITILLVATTLFFISGYVKELKKVEQPNNIKKYAVPLGLIIAPNIVYLLFCFILHFVIRFSISMRYTIGLGVPLTLMIGCVTVAILSILSRNPHAKSE